ncbi:MAG: hypothetical protein F4152_00280 [Dehalococcoidia bacterium]|nr:hypothetical protein [Dehalococcoidia bacterium]
MLFQQGVAIRIAVVAQGVQEGRVVIIHTVRKPRGAGNPGQHRGPLGIAGDGHALERVQGVLVPLQEGQLKERLPDYLPGQGQVVPDEFADTQDGKILRLRNAVVNPRVAKQLPRHGHVETCSDLHIDEGVCIAPSNAVLHPGEAQDGSGQLDIGTTQPPQRVESTRFGVRGAVHNPGQLVQSIAEGKVLLFLGRAGWRR